MSADSPTDKLSQVFDSLPHGAQYELLEKHIFPALNSVPKDQYDSIVSVAMEHQTRLRSMPKLNKKVKKQELDGLMEALNCDSKIAFVKERSNREALLAEIVDSLTSWLSDIWVVVYDYREDFMLAHKCLMFTAHAVSTLQDARGVGCSCYLRNIPIDITIKRTNGQIMKAFALKGPLEIIKVLLWIWRELLLSISAYGNASVRKRMPEIIEDIESLLGWEALERLVYGGKACTVRNPLAKTPRPDEDEDEEDEDEDGCDRDGDSEDEEEGEAYFDPYDDDAWENEGGDPLCSCAFPMRHWSDLIRKQRTPLRELILDHLHSNFRKLPSMKLYRVISGITHNFDKTHRILLQELSGNATKSSETFAGALFIYCATHNASQVDRMLCGHYHLLRTHDKEVIQLSVALLMDSPFASHAVQVLEREFLECVRAVHSAVVLVFGHIEREERKKDIEIILKARRGSQEREDRITQWLDKINTHTDTTPTTFASMMMGFPFTGSPDDGDMVAFLDGVDTSDPDYADMVEQYRPPLKERFMGWYVLLTNSRGSPRLAGKMYNKTVELMPFLRGADVVEAMATKLNGMYGKSHVADGLDAVAKFCTNHYKKIQRPARPRKPA